jgi:hypothetical protein
MKEFGDFPSSGFFSLKRPREMLILYRTAVRGEGVRRREDSRSSEARCGCEVGERPATRGLLCPP